MGNNSSTLILGLGNILLGDEGFGVHVAQRLKEADFTSNIKVEEGGVGGFNLLGHLENVERLLVVDVMMLDAPPGQLFLMKPGPDFVEPGKNIISFHQVGVIELVKMWGLLGYEPEIFFLVTRPEKLEWSTSLSPSLQHASEEAFELIKKLCLNNFTELERSRDLCIL